MNHIEYLLEHKPFKMNRIEKSKLFLSAMNESIEFHYSNSLGFKKIIDGSKKGKSFENIESIPYLPIILFKKIKLTSVPDTQIVSVIKSSATTGGVPSTIYLDEITRKRQIKCLNSILSSFMGSKRTNFIIFDTEKTITSKEGELSSRGSAIRGLMPFAKSLNFVLDNGLKLESNKFNQVLEKLKGEEIYIFGFTWLLYKTLSQLNPVKISQCKVLHIGGWKKLKDIEVSKEEFNRKVESNLGTEDIYDIYGMTEQLGTVYIDCEQGYKHVPIYSEILMRDIENLKSSKEGFIQLISPIPHSYPGISILTDDIGKIIGEDDCLCGRKGKYFIFKERAKNAELKGCGDTLQ
jgi:phenylacetate-coenzyme A ligase PaaK-like adenylate-forming protein